MITTAEVEAMVLKALPGSRVEAVDMTGSSDHFEVTVVSAACAGKSMVDQHRMVFAALEKEMDYRIHAVKLKTRASEL